MACIDRTLEEVEALLEFSKVDSSSLLPVSQTLEFPDDYDGEKFTLMQLPESLVAVLKKGDRLVLRGDEEDSAVLCTDTETFEVREAETSNSLVVVPDLLVPETMPKDGEGRLLENRQIAGIHFAYLEVRSTLPRLHKVRELLEEAPFAGAEAELDLEEAEQRRYTFADLLERVQCSEEQLCTALEQLPALHMGGHWRSLDFSYQFGVVSAIVGEIEEMAWQLDAVPHDEVLQKLKNTEPMRVLKMCLNHFFDKPGQAPGTVGLNDNKLARLYAEVLLKPAANFNLTEFLAIWPQSVPEGVNTSLDQLAGLALVDNDSSPPTISHYPAYKLPLDPILRFEALFEARPMWTLDQIAPYVRDMTSPKISATSIIAKHSRTSTKNGIKYFSAKHKK